jgi:1-acyl-sn-glycerol-3-phosphate acyltransferase
MKGMQFFDFIFLKRKLAMDKDTIVSNLERSKRSDQPMWLVLFPEGTGKITIFVLIKKKRGLMNTSGIRMYS